MLDPPLSCLSTPTQTNRHGPMHARDGDGLVNMHVSSDKFWTTDTTLYETALDK